MQSRDSPVRAPEQVLAVLDRLHKAAMEQEQNFDHETYGRIVEAYRTNPTASIATMDEAMQDQFVALERTKCDFIYQLIIATNAHNIVEAGTSFGVSTIYLALALAEAEKQRGGTLRKVIATEKDENKATVAKTHWAECGSLVQDRIDLRVGDLLETLGTGVEQVDFLVLDIWQYMALPTLRMIEPRLKPGATIVTDNVVIGEEGYKDLLAVLRDPNGDYRSLTLPFDSGFEISIYTPR